MPRTRFLVLLAAVWSLVTAAIITSAKLIAKLWQRVPIHCTRCCRPLDPESVSPGEPVAWCPHCHSTFEAPLLKAPSWVTGVLAILVINLQ